MDSINEAKEMKMQKLLSLVFVCSLCLVGAGQAWAQCTEPVACSDPSGIVTLAGNITSSMTLESACDYEIDGLVVVTNGATLTIPAGTTLYGLPGSGSSTSYMIVDTAGNDVGGTWAPGAKIIAAGSASSPIIFTSEAAYLGGEGAGAPGQWGGLTIVGNAGNPQVGPYEVDPRYAPTSTNSADNSGVLSYVQINNSGITMDVDKEINGLSLCGVGSGTVISNITVNRSDDDCVEIWGGTVNLSNITTNICTDDQFDTDDGYSGTVTNLVIYQDGGNAAMEMSGNTPNQTFDGVTITQVDSAKEGVLYFKEPYGVGGSFSNVTICDEDYDASYGVFHSNGTPLGTLTMDNIDVYSTSLDFTGPSGTALQSIFNGCATCSDNALPCP
jgi:hypothetical protein